MIILFLFNTFFIYAFKNDMSELKIIAENGVYPITFLNKRTNKADGFAVDIVNEILKRLELEKEITLLLWARCFNYVTTRDNYTLLTMSKIPEREPLVKWVGNLFDGEASIYVKNDSNIELISIEDAKLIPKIGTYRSSFDEKFLLNLGFKNLESNTTEVQNIKKLMFNRVDTISAFNITLICAVEDAGYSMDDIKKILTFQKTGNYLAFSLNVSNEIIELWQNTLNEMYKDGTIENLKKKWLY